METLANGEVSELRLIIKADVQGSVDVLTKTCTELGTEEVRVGILHAGVGGITEGDVLLAEASGAIIIGFNVVAEAHTRTMAEERGVDIRSYRVIYEVVDEIRQSLLRLLGPAYEERVVGRLEVRQIFHISRVGTVAGCLVTEGMIRRSVKVRVIRDHAVIRDEAELASLRRFKDDVREVRSGLECGVRIGGFDDLKPADVIEAYEKEQVERTL